MLMWSEKMKIKTSSFAAALAVLLALALVFAVPVSAEGTEMPAVEDGVITLIDNVVLSNTWTVDIDTTVILNLNGHSISHEKACTSSYEMIKNDGHLTIVDTVGGGKISFKDTGSGDPNFNWGSYTIHNRGTLIVGDETSKDFTIEHLGEQNPGNGQPNVHMYCAIHQGWPSNNQLTAEGTTTTINCGKISTPTYRSIRINRGTLTINGGDIDGQVWMQPFAENYVVVINGGSFSPNGNDEGSVSIGNSQYNVIMSVTDGTFTTKIGVADAAKAGVAGSITGGTFSEAALSGTDNALFNPDTPRVTNPDGTTSFGSSIPAPETPSVSSSSSVTPTPGAYFNYPRTTEDGGLVEFGTSKVVKSVTLPAGSSGKVNLHIDSTAYWPLSLDSEFTFDISVDNLGEGTSYISFKIAESKLTALELTAADVGVYHDVNGEWVKLVVTYTIEDGDVIYTAETDSFSPFKLVIEEGAAVQKEEVTPSEPVVDEPVIPDVPQDVPGEVLPEIPDNQDEPETPASPAPVLGLLAALGAAVVLRRK